MSIISKEILYSIILPAYNAEDYICICIESVLEQTYKNFELIIINDGSTDKTDILINKYRESDGRIIYISKKKNGVSAARNEGIQRSKGDYLIFVDSDDVVNRDLLYELNKKIIECNASLDYIRFEYKIIDEDGIYLYPNYEARKRKRITKNLFSADTCIGKVVRNEFFLWSGAFKKQIIDKHEIRFKEGCTYNEDTLFMITFFLYSKTHTYVDKILYEYRKYGNAVTSAFTERNYDDVKGIFLDIQNILSIKEISLSLRREIKYVADNLGLRLLNYIIDNCYDIGFGNEILNLCICNKVDGNMLYEWKIIKQCGIRTGMKLIGFINLCKRVKRKLDL